MSTSPPEIFDRAAYRARRERAGHARGDAFLAREAAEHIAQRLNAVNRRFMRALDLDSREEIFSILRSGAENWVRAGYRTEMPDIVAEVESLPFADSRFDLVTSVLSLHAVNDLPGALTQIRRALAPDGLFLAALFGGETLYELRLAFAAAEAEVYGGASPRVAPFADVRALGGLLQRAGFALPVADAERITVNYRDPARLFADLRNLGETNALTGRRHSFLTRKLLAAVTREYRERFATADGKFPATFEIVFLTGWSAHESQQKPLAPGSAKHRLADALKAGESKTPREI